jgi:hypothetical protein
MQRLAAPVKPDTRIRVSTPGRQISRGCVS